MENVTREQVRPLPVAAAPMLEPYRVLFPLGAALAIAGVLPWIAYAFGLVLWPGLLHAELMIEGFELAFVSGFLLTAMPAFTHGAKASRTEVMSAATGVTLAALAGFAGLPAFAHGFAALTFVQLLFSVGGRVRFGAAAPPEEFALVGIGLLLGVTGCTWQALLAAGIAHEPSLHLAARLLSRGTVLALVLGLGGLLVPTFRALPDPLTIPGVARAGDRPPRRAFTAAIALALVGALALEGAGHEALAAWLRVAAAAASTLLAWKIAKGGGRRDGVARAIHASGHGVLGGLVLAALLPAHAIAAWHVVFVAGYGLLTLGIGTRVVVSHGGHGLADEAAVLGRATVVLTALALVSRLAAEWAGAGLAHALAAAAALWAAAWIVWLLRAWPRVRRTKRVTLMPQAPRPR